MLTVDSSNLPVTDNTKSGLLSPPLAYPLFILLGILLSYLKFT